MIENEENGTQSARVYAELETLILSGGLGPGTRLNEPELAKRFSTSRGPLREAIRQLEGRKLIKRIERTGSTVVDLSPEDLAELFEIREVLEGLACRLATETMSSSDLELLEQSIDREHQSALVTRADAPLAAPKKAADFHLLIIRGSRSHRLADTLLGEYYPLMKLYRFKSRQSPGRLQQALSEHGAILSAMRSREPKEAELLMRRHIRSARINLLSEERRALGG